MQCVKLYKAKDPPSSTILFDKILVTAIGFGDLLTGVYLLAISIIDVISLNSYCKIQLEWLTGLACAMVGVVSTIGAQLSLFAMVTLALTRAINIVRGSLVKPRPATARDWVYVAMVLGMIGGVSVAIATTPLLPPFQDFFVNGQTYDPALRIFSGAVNK